MTKQIAYFTLKTELITMAAGSVSISSSESLIVNATVDTSGGATEDLTAINGGFEGMILILQSASNTRIPTVKNGEKIHLQEDFTLDNIHDSLVLICIGTDSWKELTRASNN